MLTFSNIYQPVLLKVILHSVPAHKDCFKFCPLVILVLSNTAFLVELFLRQCWHIVSVGEASCAHPNWAQRTYCFSELGGNKQARNLRRCALKAGKTSTRKTENLAHLTYLHAESGMRNKSKLGHL